MEQLVFDFGESIDRTRFCRWHFCRCDMLMLLNSGVAIEVIITYN